MSKTPKPPVTIKQKSRAMNGLENAINVTVNIIVQERNMSMCYDVS